MKYPQLVSSNAAISAISDWLVFKLDELGVDAPLVFSRFLLSLLHYQANHVDFLEVRREAVESLKQVSSSIEDNKESEIVFLVEELHSKLKKIEGETTLSASISFEPFSQNECFHQMQKDQTIIEEDPKKKYYMAFPALNKDDNSDDVTKYVPKSLNWSSIINIRADKRNPIQANKTLKTKRKRNFGRGKFDYHKKNVTEPEPILWDMDFKGNWEMSTDLYSDFISKQNQINKNVTDAKELTKTSTKQNKRCQNDTLTNAMDVMYMPRQGDDIYRLPNNGDDDDDEDNKNENYDDGQPANAKNIDLFEINENFCDSQHLHELKSKFDSKVRALWDDDREDVVDCRYRDSENIIQNLAISLQLLQNNNNHGGGLNENCGKSPSYCNDYAPEQTTLAHNFIKYGTNLNCSIWSDSVSVYSENQTFWENSSNDTGIINKSTNNEQTKSILEWSDNVFEVLHSINEDHNINSTMLPLNTNDDSAFAHVESECYSTVTVKNDCVKIPLVEVTLPNHSADSRFSEVIPSFFKEQTQQLITEQNSSVVENAAANYYLPTYGSSEHESNENLLTSEQTHFRPIKFPISPYIDGYSFRISNSPIKVEEIRSETGSLYINTQKFMEYKKNNSDFHPDIEKWPNGNTKNVEEFIIKFKVRQNEKFCQTENDYNNYADDEPMRETNDGALIAKSVHDGVDVGFWRMDNTECLQQEPCINDPVNKWLVAELSLDGDEIMSDLSFIQNLYIGHDWNSECNYECIDGGGQTSELATDYYDHNYGYNIVYDLLKPETTKTLSEVLTQQVFAVPATSNIVNGVPSNHATSLINENDYDHKKNKLNSYNNSIQMPHLKDCYKVVAADEMGNGRRKRRYSECLKDIIHFYEGVQVLPFVQDSVASENFIACKFWTTTTNFTFIDQTENDNNYSNLFIGLSRPLTR